MYAFGVDVPLIEILVGLAIVNVIVLIEVTVALIFVLYKLKHSRHISSELKNLAETLLKMKEKELELMGKLKKGR